MSTADAAPARTPLAERSPQQLQAYLSEKRTAFAALKDDWSEASASLGGTGRDFWRRVGIPVLMPSVIAGTVLLFASSMGAYATAQALIGSRVNLMTIQISILRRGEILYQPAQADAMATVLLAIVALSVLAYHIMQRSAQRWTHA